MRYTENLHLNLPEDTDPLEVSRLSENFENLDAAVAAAGTGGESFQVGDILATYRTGLGDDWLLCDGSAFDTGKYPDLAGICPNILTMASNVLVNYYAISVAVNTTTYTIATRRSFATDGGITVFVGRWSNSSVDRLFYTDDNSESIHYLDKATDDINERRPSYVFYVNGYWIIVYTFTANWTGISAAKDIVNNDYSKFETGADYPKKSYTNFTVEYYNGKYCIIPLDSTPTVTYSEKPYFSDAADYLVPMTNYVTATKWSFVRTSKYFVFIGSDSSRGITDIVYSTDPIGGYKEVHISGTHKYSTAIGFFPLNDTIGYITNSSPYGLCWFEDIATGSINSIILPDNFSTTAGFKALHASGSYILFAGDRLFLLPNLSPDAAISFINFPQDMLLDYDTQYIYNMVYSDPMYPSFHSGAFSFLYQYHLPIMGTSGTAIYKRTGTFSPYAVPNISLPQGYVYIKAKDGGGSPPTRPGTGGSGGSSGSSGSGGTSDHRLLSNRDTADQHPIGAITGLTAKLNRIPNPVEALTNAELEALLT